MTESSWEGEASEAPPKKKGMPKWIWFCGSGCLVMVVIAAVLAVLGVREVQKAVNPETQWAAVSEHISFDERPEDLKIARIPLVDLAPGVEGIWMLIQDELHQGVLMVFSGDESEEIEQGMFDAEQGELDLGSLTGNMGQRDFTSGTVMVQGRELRCARFQSFPADEEGDESSGGIKSVFEKAVMRVDVTPEDVDDRIVLVEYSKVQTLEPVSDEEINDFLAPFLIGPDR